ncbi:unnamed protein product [Ambrosiozyma monospora]|uniref:Unnamed protein product n=1 Tax=Ambrosiozyma monospora TaxID=43982 RepID=A0A9W6Z1H6_AMBMO|nr:unnamed protein product [Ambrosiozyma monospora]
MNRQSSKNQIPSSSLKKQQQPQEPKSKLRRNLLKVSYLYSNIINKLKLITDVCLDSDEITEELFDSSNSESEDDFSRLDNHLANNNNLNFNKEKSLPSLPLSQVNNSNSNSLTQPQLQPQQSATATATTNNTTSANTANPSTSGKLANSTTTTTHRTTLEDKMSLDDNDNENTNSNTSSAIATPTNTSTNATSDVESQPQSSNIKCSNTNSKSNANHARTITPQKPTEPFIGGEELWKLQNQEWLKPSPENSTLEGKHKLQQRLSSLELRKYVATKDYYIVYKNLVINNRSLKKPMNLRDLLNVVEAGWTWTRVFEKAGRGVQ